MASLRQQFRQLIHAERMAQKMLDHWQQRKEALAKARSKRRPKCRCAAYPWPHRPAGGLCRCPDPPLATWQGTPGKNRAAELRYRRYRRWLCRQHGLHPIRDRAVIAKLLPGLHYAAWAEVHARCAAQRGIY
jgi:hypothetical protein